MDDSKAESLISNSGGTSRWKGKNSGNIVCPNCGKSVNIISFGSGWVGTCCGRVLYNSDKLPDES